MMISMKQLIATLRTHEKRAPRLEISDPVGRAAAELSGDARLTVDHLTLSSRAQDMLKARGVLNDMPPLREDRLAQIKERVQSGTYEVPSQDVAAKIISRAVVNRLLSDGGG